MTVGKYVSIDTAVEIEIDVKYLRELDEDDFLDVVAARGMATPPDRQIAERAYLALTPATPEPIRELVLICARRIA